MLFWSEPLLTLTRTKVTGRFGPIPVRTPSRFGPIPFRSGRFGLGRFGPISGWVVSAQLGRVVSAHFILYRFLSVKSYSCLPGLVLIGDKSFSGLMQFLRVIIFFVCSDLIT